MTFSVFSKRQNLGQLLAGQSKPPSFIERLKATFGLSSKGKLADELVVESAAPQGDRNEQLLSHSNQSLLKRIFTFDSTAETDQEKQRINHYFKVASAALGLNLLTPFYAPLSLVSIPLLLYTVIPYYQYGYEGLKNRKLNIGVVDTILITGVLLSGYIVIAAFTSWILMLSEKLILATEDNSQQKLVNILGDTPRTVWVQRDEVEVQIPFEKLQLGDVVVVNAGETIPIDGKIIEGLATIDQHALTGESQPVEKGGGDTVLASTVILSGRILIEVERSGEDTVAAQIGQILQNTADFRAQVQERGKKVANKYALPTLVIGAVTWPVYGATSALTVLLSSFGYNMRLVSPISVLNFLQITSQNGILIKDGRSLELLNEVDTVIFDKTGTLTLEQPHVGDLYLYHGLTEAELLTYAGTAEYRQTHPVAKAILAEAEKRQLSLPPIDEASYEVGYGIRVTVNDDLIRVGSARFMEMEAIELPDSIIPIQERCYNRGYTLIYVAVGQQFCGAIELRPTIRPEAPQIISQLKEQGVALYIISGDHAQPTQRLAEELGIEHYFAEVLPENKGDLVDQLKNEGRTVCFVGDGINDSIALKKAHVSVSLSGATTIAMDTAQIVLMSGTLKQLAHLFTIAHDYERNMQTNFITTIVPGILCIGGVYFLHFGILSGLLLYNIGLAGGVTNAMLPLLTADSNQETYN